MKLFPRRSGQASDQTVQWRAKAHRILDAWRAGQDIKPELILWALRLTGDAS